MRFVLSHPDLELSVKNWKPAMTIMCSQGGTYGTLVYLGAVSKYSPTGFVLPEVILTKRNTVNFDPKTVSQDAIKAAFSHISKVSELIDAMKSEPLKTSKRNAILMEVGRSTNITWTRIGKVDGIMQDTRQNYLELSKAFQLAVGDIETVKQVEMLRNIQFIISSYMPVTA
jgi:hypothetical protein